MGLFNAASLWSFPAVLAFKQRTVYFTAEAYFEVTNITAMAFIVKVNDMDVQVFGTYF